ncbi:MAG: hypothetical protein KGL38_03155 [Gemmatimonadota bacterium]|nr:hypothetical protein [Gemmatimonadota bacterium]MDE3126974.1 hypothetical protein [Gemmatimonadota bacterium]MDE3172593.1 hypothetical protein [Gemmatimonadota bacterium]MDE3217283.1 hypothetical protein [Gemmatimonadota bacterium]
MTRTAIRNAALVAAACALAACADSPITSPALTAPGAAPSFSVAGGQAKVDVCHRMAKGYVKLTVGAPAEQAHLGHGDMLPGTFTPDFLWYMTPDCQLEPNVSIG